MEYTNYTQKLMDQYDLEAEDVMLCTLIRSGWGKYEAIFHAYHLQWFDMPKLNIFFRERTKARPGIMTLQSDWNVEDRASQKELRELKDKLKEKKKKARDAKLEMEAMNAPDADKMTKEELGKLYVRIMRSDTDDKTKMDASKAYSALYQMQKEQKEEEDNRLVFHLSHNCHYCDRCKTCELKTELEQHGYRIRAKRTSPYIWEIEKDDNTNNNNSNENQ